MAKYSTIENPPVCIFYLTWKYRVQDHPSSATYETL